MAFFYADSTVLIKRHIIETGTAWVRQITEAGSGYVSVTSHVSEVEVFSACNRRVGEGTLNATDYATLITDFMAITQTEYEIVEVTPTVVAQTRRLLEAHPLHAYDAIQLAAALTANAPLVVASLNALTFLQ